MPTRREESDSSPAFSGGRVLPGVCAQQSPLEGACRDRWGTRCSQLFRTAPRVRVCV